ncbi:MAG: hypothetical protein A2V79_11700 [Betaproteobacteria bacterium RBG_16_56_24]|nr:MAG: hypothetical protein A2V79_11700 [Betaproteobacteria bacterium RBG_16_56_24]
MSLTCECGYDGDYSWYYITPDNYTTLKTKRRRRCSSCEKLIEISAVTLEFECWKEDANGNETPRASLFMCEECGDIHYSLMGLGFCVYPLDNMHELLAEYVAKYGRKA